MKKIIVMLSLASCVFMLSCSNDQDGQKQGFDKSHREEARELLRQMNAENPYAEYGIDHNAAVAGMMNELKKTTRSGDSLSVFLNSVKTQSLERADSILTANNINSYTLDDVEDAYDSVVPSIISSKPTNINLAHPSLTEGLSSDAVQLIATVDEILKDEDDSSVSVLNRLNSVFSHAQALLQGDELVELAMITAIASNSVEYWMEEHPINHQFSNNFNAAQWKQAAVPDVYGAIIAAKIIIGPNGVKVVPTISAAASSLSAAIVIGFITIVQVEFEPFELF
ncbi:MAG: hypothetical protein J5552_05190 [Prevotella sp.]|nr:hypothetical protein [Prevotella sp.]